MTELRTLPPSEHPLDRASAVNFYVENLDTIQRLLPQPAELNDSFPITGQDHIALTPENISSLISLFPESSRQRSNLIDIEGRQALYFGRQSTYDQSVTTSDIGQAISPTTFAVAKTEGSRESGVLKSTAILFEIPKSVDPQVRRIMHAEGFVHEYIHSITAPILDIPSYRLRLSGGEVVEGRDLLERFAKLAEAEPPFSKYIEEYRKKAKQDDNNKRLRAVDEEFTQFATAVKLGFVYTADKARSFNPLGDNPEMKQFILDFFNAEKIE